MDDLPSDVLLNIFARLPDSTDLANCRLTSHRLLSLSYLISSISLQPNKCHNPIPFMTRVINLASLLASSLRSLSITAKLDDNAISELNDLTDDNFLSAWLPLLGAQLQSLSLFNSWTKSRVGFSNALAIISDTCMQEINTFCILMSEPPNQISLRNQYKYINNPHICCVSMDDLPSDVLLNIFARLPDSTDLANCRLTSRRLISLSYHVSSISLQPHRQYNPIPFKTQVVNLVSLLSLSLQSISISARSDNHAVLHERDSRDNEIDGINDLTHSDFLSAWLPLVGRQLRSLRVVNCWSKYRAGFSSALSLISDICGNLENLVIRKARLSFSGLKVMLKLTSLTLEFVTIDDENLVKINECLPFLQVLNMIRIIGLKEPKIQLLHLQACRFTGYPQSIIIRAPNLTELKLRCIEPSLLILECPSVSDLNISIVKPSGMIQMETPKDLKKLTIKSLDIPRLLRFFKGTKNLRTLQLEVSPIMSWFESYSIFSVGDILDTFGSIDELIFGPVAWYLWQRAFPPCLNIANRMCLWRIIVNLPPENFNNIAIVSNVLKMCARSCEVHLIFYFDVAEMKKEEIITKLLNFFPSVRWTWSTSDKLSLEFFDRLPQPHLYTSLQR